MTKIIKLLTLCALISAVLILSLTDITQAAGGVASPKLSSRVLDLRAAPVITGTKVDVLWTDNDGDSPAAVNDRTI